MRPYWIVFPVMISLILAACAPSQPAEEELPALDPQAHPTREQVLNAPTGPFPTATESIMPDFSSAPLEKFVNLTKKDLAGLLNIDVEKISLTQSMPITWPDASLGCPRPGMVYAKGHVPGYRIRLTANLIEYVYHTDLTGRFVLCPENNEDPDSGTPSAPNPDAGPTIGVPIQ